MQSNLVKMKKVLIAAIAAVLLSFATSCEKKCTCKHYVAGTVTEEYEYSISKESEKKCSDFEATPVTTDANGQQVGWECK